MTVLSVILSSLRRHFYWNLNQYDLFIVVYQPISECYVLNHFVPYVILCALMLCTGYFVLTRPVLLGGIYTKIPRKRKASKLSNYGARIQMAIGLGLAAYVYITSLMHRTHMQETVLVHLDIHPITLSSLTATSNNTN